MASRVGHKPAELSGGEQQRVGIARALVKQPSLMLADEPTGNLDSRSSEEVVGLLQRLNHQEGLTVVIVTHDPEVAACTRRIISMRDGLVVGEEQVRNPHLIQTSGYLSAQVPSGRLEPAAGEASSREASSREASSGEASSREASF